MSKQSINGKNGNSNGNHVTDSREILRGLIGRLESGEITIDQLVDRTFAAGLTAGSGAQLNDREYMSGLEGDKARLKSKLPFHDIPISAVKAFEEQIDNSEGDDALKKAADRVSKMYEQMMQDNQTILTLNKFITNIYYSTLIGAAHDHLLEASESKNPATTKAKCKDIIRFIEPAVSRIIAKEALPMNSFLFIYLGQAYLGNKDAEKAISAYSHAIENFPDNMPDDVRSMLYHLRGQAYELLGDEEKSREDFEKASQLIPSSEESVERSTGVNPLIFADIIADSYHSSSENAAQPQDSSLDRSLKGALPKENIGQRTNAEPAVNQPKHDPELEQPAAQSLPGPNLENRVGEQPQAPIQASAPADSQPVATAPVTAVPEQPAQPNPGTQKSKINYAKIEEFVEDKASKFYNGSAYAADLGFKGAKAVCNVSLSALRGLKNATYKFFTIEENKCSESQPSGTQSGAQVPQASAQPAAQTLENSVAQPQNPASSAPVEQRAERGLFGHIGDTASAVYYSRALNPFINFFLEEQGRETRAYQRIVREIQRYNQGKPLNEQRRIPTPREIFIHAPDF